MSGEALPVGRRRLLALVALLSLALAAGTYFQSALSVLSAYLLREFSISRSQLGLALTAFFVTSAITSPFLGRLADRATRRVMSGLFLASSAAVLLAAAAPAYPVIVAAAVLAGLGLGAANPVTNRLISEDIPRRRRGLVLGIKQAGAPLGLFAAGLLLAPTAAALGWRWALALTALIPLSCLVLTRKLVADDLSRRPSIPPRPAEGGRSSRGTMWWLAAIGVAASAGIGAVVGFVSLYAHEELHMSEPLAGLLAGVLGVTGIVGRVGWGEAASRRGSPGRALTVVALLSLGSTLAIWAAGTVAALVWVGAIGAGLSMMAWHAVAWLALLTSADPADIGRTTGVVQFGSSMGSALGPPIMGLLVDGTGAYSWGWAFVSLLFLMVLGLTLMWRRSLRLLAERCCSGRRAS